MNFFKKAINAVNDTVQDFDFDIKAAGKTVVNTVKTTPATMKERKDSIMTHYEDMKIANQIKALEDAEAPTTEEIIEAALENMTPEQLAQLLERKGLNK